VTAFYNEIDPFAASWLRELIKAGHIAPGIVDERSIEDIRPDELREFTQCHFFAGIGVWSYALRSAGWPDSRPVWTGSCPCQPFSTAGKRAGMADERHLWPSWFYLIEQSRPPVVFGEQVEAAIRLGWLDLVQDDLEGSDYTFGAVGLPAAGFGAPHIRQRLYFVADTVNQRRKCQSDKRSSRLQRTLDGKTEQWDKSCYYGSSVGELANAAELRRDQRRSPSSSSLQGQCSQRSGQHKEPEHVGQLSGRPERLCGLGYVGNTNNQGSQGQQFSGFGSDQRAAGSPGLVNGFWGEADWIWCRDQKYRPVEPGTFPLAHGAPNRVGRLRGYGNAIVAPVAQAFIEAYLDSEKCSEKSCQ
jgi:DNA (cytosine-5)-methyltransferase 1